MPPLYFSGKPSTFHSRIAEQLGIASYLLLHTQRHRERELVEHFNMLLSGIYHEQARFFFDHIGTPIGYVIWAYPSPAVQLQLSRNSGFVLHESEWDEGGPPWIIDFVVQSEHIRAVLRELRDTTFARDQLVRFIHTKPARTRVVTWKL